MQGTRPLAHTLSGGYRTAKQSSFSATRKLSPIERTTSAGGKTPQMLPESDVEHYESISTYSNKIPLPHLEKPVYVHFEEQPLDDDMAVYAV